MFDYWNIARILHYGNYVSDAPRCLLGITRMRDAYTTTEFLGSCNCFVGVLLALRCINSMSGVSVDLSTELITQMIIPTKSWLV